MTIKCLCSFGGRTLPRPSDGMVRYVGGQTRILRLRKDISWLELMQKALLICNLVRVLKYQLPGEDLDALVSVFSDEDLQNMMEEWYLLEKRERSQKLRLFLFSNSDLEDAQFALRSIGDESEVQYVVAVNGMDFGLINSSTPLVAVFQQMIYMNWKYELLRGRLVELLSPIPRTPAPLQPFESCQKCNFPEAAVIVTMPAEHLSSLPSTKKVQNKDCEEASSTSSNAFSLLFKRTPREQVELLNHSSKSDDTQRSQIHVSDLLSDVTTEDTVTKSGDNLDDGKMLTPTAELGTAAKPLLADGHTIDNGFSKNQMSKLLPDTNNLISQNYLSTQILS
ncbi:hypothetical protein Fmac_032114 [Flemingia macrophylla]|uniref:PB1 domain-containing protein n=1 Tax=Flemingia macrophylla TaxID=520843 RepID=A0ABD1L3Z1_9FABA